MISRYEVTLNNTQMGSLDSSILIHDVQYEKPRYSRPLFQIAERQGARAGKAYKQRAAVTITFEIRKYDITDRQDVLAKIVKWARNGGDLRINDRPNQKLICVCDELPSIESVRDWTSEMSMTFAAYAIPYWQRVNSIVTGQMYTKEQSTTKDDIFSELTVSNVPGNAPSSLPQNIYIKNFTVPQGAGGSKVYVELINTSRDDGTFAFDFTLWSGTTPEVEYSYDENQIMTLKYTSGVTSHNLTGRLSGIGDLLLLPGQNNVIKYAVYMKVSINNVSTYVPLDCYLSFGFGGWWE